MTPGPPKPATAHCNAAHARVVAPAHKHAQPAGLPLMPPVRNDLPALAQMPSGSCDPLDRLGRSQLPEAMWRRTHPVHAAIAPRAVIAVFCRVAGSCRPERPLYMRRPWRACQGVCLFLLLRVWRLCGADTAARRRHPVLSSPPHLPPTIVFFRCCPWRRQVRRLSICPLLGADVCAHALLLNRATQIQVSADPSSFLVGRASARPRTDRE